LKIVLQKREAHFPFSILNFAFPMLHPFFIISLLLLAINDHYLKYEYPGWFTGKLSDFAGIYVLTYLLFRQFPNKIRLISASVAIAFIWWKSPHSSPIIGYLNTINLPMERVVDYSDLMALIVMIPAYHYSRFVATELRYSLLSKSALFIAPIILCSTSMIQRTAYSFNFINKTYAFEMSKASLVAELNKLQLDDLSSRMDYNPKLYTFNSNDQTFYFQTNTAAATLFDPTKIQDSDTLSIYYMNARVFIRGDDQRSSMELLELRTNLRKPVKDAIKYREKMIGHFENKVVRKIKND
jgi:hypothetical protein